MPASHALAMLVHCKLQTYKMASIIHTPFLFHFPVTWSLFPTLIVVLNSSIMFGLGVNDTRHSKARVLSLSCSTSQLKPRNFSKFRSSIEKLKIVFLSSLIRIMILTYRRKAFGKSFLMIP